jgi:hypothetical protein
VTRTIVVAAVAAVAVAAAVPAAAAGAVAGQMRVLYVLTTWGPQPFTIAETQRVADETDAFFRASSAGRFAMPGAVAELTLPRNVVETCSASELRAETPPALLAGYDRVAFVTPLVSRCQFAGEADPTEVYLNGRLFRALAAHELGHTLGLGHASSFLCVASTCRVEEYGGLFSTMGGGMGDFNAYEKNALGWLTAVVRPDRNGTHEIGPVDGPSAAPQALVVTTARSEFWFESRSVPVTPFQPGLPQLPGVVVVAGPAGGDSPYPRHNLVLPNPAGGERYAYLAGESFVEPGVFRVTVDSHAVSATLRFEWLDRTQPGRPRLRVRTQRAARVRLEWDPPVERGSGLESYSLLLDGRVVRTLEPIAYTATVRAGRGLHRVGVAATDRAGNRGPTASVRVRLR